MLLTTCPGCWNWEIVGTSPNVYTDSYSFGATVVDWQVLLLWVWSLTLCGRVIGSTSKRKIAKSNRADLSTFFVAWLVVDFFVQLDPLFWLTKVERTPEKDWRAVVRSNSRYSVLERSLYKVLSPWLPAIPVRPMTLLWSLRKSVEFISEPPVVRML